MSLITDRQPETNTYDIVLDQIHDLWSSPEDLARKITSALGGRKVGQPRTTLSVGPHESFAREYAR